MAIEDSFMFLEFLLNEVLVWCWDRVKRGFKVVFKKILRFYDNSYMIDIFTLLIAFKSLLGIFPVACYEYS